eukprot:TRINITY_DN4543_c0_g3_i1.p1 TRINITY_DN4543_c0_g3~~TRINITY_DN4543_c0_g3_i1.p1  ORF type:complete len:214 (-),score=30.22 TRINITY_DN4543_c0_g3_i1:266-907(-)
MTTVNEVPTLTLARPPGKAPWESDSVYRFVNKLRNDESGVCTMSLQGRQGKPQLLAVGSQQDHIVAGQTASKLTALKSASSSTASSRPRSQLGLAATGMELERSTRKILEIQAREQVAFGAVYEHRDSCGKPRLIGSTDKLPERQFELDWKRSEPVKLLCQQGMRSELVWAGIGYGDVGEAEMAEVRQAVVDARAERLRIEKLNGIKPYSHHT